MKIFSKTIAIISALLFTVACNEGIDPISKVDPGTDETAPQITVNNPKEGMEVKSETDTANLLIQFIVSDDIEIGSVTVSVDGVQIAAYNEFIDYRRYLGEIDYLVTEGEHMLTIAATDLEGKSSTLDVHFFKASAFQAYEPVYPNETLYMPFDGDYRDYFSGTNANVIGTPGFAGDKVFGDNAYAGASDAYLLLPSDDLETEEFSAVMWIKPNAVPDRAGILVVGPEDIANPGAENLRTSGFRFFREGSATEQRFKLNVGTGDGESWNDGGVVNPSDGEWVHLAFTITATQSSIYINGELQLQADLASPISWADCNEMSIMSGAPHFNGWNHLSDLSYLDELRTFNKALSQSEIQSIIARESSIQVGYTPKFDGEIFYMPFDGDYAEKVGNRTVTEVGTPGFSGEGFSGGNAYMGAADSHLEISTEGLTNSEFSATFWYKANPVPNRAGILVIGPEDSDNPDAQNIRTSGFRFFREASGTKQIFKLNAGSGDADSWFDGGAAATIDPASGEWVFMAFTISGIECVCYINGEVAAQGEFPGIDWTGCDILSIGSGAPRFTGWEHYSDLSALDELRLYNKALTLVEVQNVMNSD